MQRKSMVSLIDWMESKLQVEISSLFIVCMIFSFRSKGPKSVIATANNSAKGYQRTIAYTFTCKSGQSIHKSVMKRLLLIEYLITYYFLSDLHPNISQNAYLSLDLSPEKNFYITNHSEDWISLAYMNVFEVKCLINK